jgi:aryl-alcohol dehydrogenase-like predicted oxidoreductase
MAGQLAVLISGRWSDCVVACPLRAFESSLERLGLDHVDLYLIQRMISDAWSPPFAT